jgi:hypothetical protein
VSRAERGAGALTGDDATTPETGPATAALLPSVQAEQRGRLLGVTSPISTATNRVGQHAEDDGAYASEPVMSAKMPGAALDELPLSEKKNQLSLAFTHMVASAAGCSIKDHKTDVDGVDITVVSSAEYETHYCPQFELQLKCTSQEQRHLNDDHMAWEMEAGPFRRLTNPKRFIPALLGVLVVPDVGSWLDQDEARLLLRGRMYWQYASQVGTISDSQGSKTVHLPRSNLFDVEQLLGIMKHIGDGGDW